MNDEQILSAYTGWKRADLMYQHFYSIAPAAFNNVDTTFMIQPHGIYLYLFHALLYSVLEFLRDQNAIPTSISTDVDLVYEPLRRFRNATFHLQDDYPSRKLLEIANLPNSRDAIKRVHSEVGKFLEQEFSARFVR